MFFRLCRLVSIFRLVYESVVQFFVTYGVFYFSNVTLANGGSGSVDINQFGQLTTTSCLICGYVNYCIDTYSFPWMTWFILIGSFIIYLGIELIYNALPIAYTIEFFSLQLQFTNPAFYLTSEKIIS